MKQWLIIFVLCGVSLCLRLYQLGAVPTILNRDEAALAYNAKLLLETGKDEWGAAWPFALQSFGDYKLPGYALVLIPFFKLFGYHDWVVRLPSVIAGLALIPLSYAFARVLGWQKKFALILATLITTTPVFFFYSRIAFEANVALSLFVGALTLLLRKTTAKSGAAMIAAIVLLLAAVFTYNTPLLLLPFVIVLLPVWYGLKNWQRWLWPVIGLIAVFIIGGSQLFSLSKQKSGITIFQDESTWRQSVENYQQFHGVPRLLFGNKIVFYGSLIAQNYAQSFSPTFLINGKGGHPWHSLPGFGHLLMSTFALGVVGIIFSVTKPTKEKIMLLFLLLTSLLPAAITVDAPHATRSLLFFFLLTVFAGYSVIELTKNRYHSAILMVVITASIALFSNYALHYFTQFSQQQVQANLKPGFNTIIQEVEQKHSHEPIAVVDDEGFHYILTAWYLEVSSVDFLNTIVHQQPDKISFRYGEQVTHYHFIAKEGDRAESEKVMVVWDKVLKTWKVHEF